jgi:hypothetical protein
MLFGKGYLPGWYVEYFKLVWFLQPAGLLWFAMMGA